MAEKPRLLLSRVKSRAQFSLIVTGFFLFLVAACFEGLETKSAVFDDQEQAERVLKEYLRLRVNRSENFKRYNLLSQKNKDFLMKSGVTNEAMFKEYISDEETFLDFKIVSLRKVGTNEIRANVWCKVVTEHDPGGIKSESQREFVLIKESRLWRFDDMIVDGGHYLP